MKIWLPFILISVGLAILAIILWPTFLNLSLNQINSQGTVINVYDGKLNNGIFFILSIALIPTLLWTALKISKQDRFISKLYILLIIIISGFALWQIRIFLLNNKLSDRSGINNLTGINIDYNFQYLNFDLYFALGLILGAIFGGLAQRYLTTEREKK